MKKLAASIAVTGVLLAGGGVVSAPVANAAFPSQCGSNNQGRTLYGYCMKGRGQVKVVGTCKNVFGWIEAVQGPWVAVGGNPSRANCKVGWWPIWTGVHVR